MQVRQLVSSFFAVAALAGLAPTTSAQTTAGAGSVVVIPTVASLAGYLTTVFVRNPGASPINVNVKYYISDSTTTPPGTPKPWLVTCGTPPGTPLNIPVASVVTFDLATQCPTGVTDNFGMIVLEDAASPKVNLFTAYSRAQNPTAIGFSVEGFPIGNFSSAPADVIGLRNDGSYRSNCFVGSLGESVDVQIQLRSGAGALFGAVQTSLGPWETMRFLDVFQAAGAPVATNVRATFNIISTGAPPTPGLPGAAFIPFCTLENNGSADFRIAKSIDASDNRQARLSCYGQDDCNAVSPTAIDPISISTTTQRNIHYTIFDQPDDVHCDLLGTNGYNASDLQLVLRAPGNSLSSTALTGPGQQSFSIYTGGKSTIAAGKTTRWYLDVSFRSGGNAAHLPISYGITCRSGNGITVPWLGTTVP